MSMIRGTTPTVTIGTPLDLNTVAVLYVTFNQNGKTVLEKSLDEVTCDDKGVITIALSQEDTLNFKDNSPLEIQVRIRTLDDTALASSIIKTTAGRILKDGTI